MVSAACPCPVAGEGPSLTSFDCVTGRLPPAVGGPLGDLRSSITVGGRRGT